MSQKTLPSTAPRTCRVCAAGRVHARSQPTVGCPPVDRSTLGQTCRGATARSCPMAGPCERASRAMSNVRQDRETRRQDSPATPQPFDSGRVWSCCHSSRPRQPGHHSTSLCQNDRPHPPTKWSPRWTRANSPAGTAEGLVSALRGATKRRTRCF